MNLFELNVFIVGLIEDLLIFILALIDDSYTTACSSSTSGFSFC